MRPAFTIAVRIAFSSVKRMWSLSCASLAAWAVVSLRTVTSVVVAELPVESVIAP